MKCKICPVCNVKNRIDDMICKECLSSMDSVEEVDCSQVEKNHITLQYENTSIEIKDGDNVGREAKASDILKDFPTASRQHAKFELISGKWFITDLESTNGTYLNDIRIESNKKIEIKNGNSIGFSKRIVFEVKI